MLFGKKSCWSFFVGCGLWLYIVLGLLHASHTRLHMQPQTPPQFRNCSQHVDLVPATLNINHHCLPCWWLAPWSMWPNNQISNIFVKTRKTKKQVKNSTCAVQWSQMGTVKVVTKMCHVQLVLFSFSTAVFLCACCRLDHSTHYSVREQWQLMHGQECDSQNYVQNNCWVRTQMQKRLCMGHSVNHAVNFTLYF